MKAVILAAGYGSRLQPFTSFRPKHMLPVAGKFILERGIEYIRDTLDIQDMVIVVGYLRNAIIDYFGNGSKLGVNIKYVIQHSTDKRGVGAALALTEEHINSDFVLYLADNLFDANLKQVIDKHFTENNHATIHVEKNPNPSRFGVVVTDGNDRAVKLIEKPKIPPSNLVISGFYVLSPIIYKYLKKLRPSKRGEFELTDALQLMIHDNSRVYISMIEGWRQDIGMPEDLLSANRKLLMSGAGKVNGNVNNSTINSPVFIHRNTSIENSFIGPNVMIEEGVRIKNSKIQNCVILENTEIIDSNLEDSIIGAKSIIRGLNGHNIVAGDFTRINLKLK